MVFTKQANKILFKILYTLLSSQPQNGCYLQMQSKENLVIGGLNMTANQISYAKLQEDRRHNVTSEQETERSNKANVGLGYANLVEQSRHNVQTEGIGWYNADNQAQANVLRGEELQFGIDKFSQSITQQKREFDEARRHNVESEQLESQRNKLQFGSSLISSATRMVPSFTSILGGIK